MAPGVKWRKSVLPVGLIEGSVSVEDRHSIESLVFSGHALHQMFARKITAEEVRAVVEQGEVVASYSDDRPYPSELLVGVPTGRTLHVVLAYNEATRTGYVVTVYVPDPELWSEDFKTRREL